MAEILKRSVGFDIDDCIAFSSPAFGIAVKNASARGGKPFVDNQFWADVNIESTKPGGMEWKTEVIDILKEHKRNGDDVHLITARPKGNEAAAKIFTEYMSTKIGIPVENIAYTSEGSKVDELLQRNIDTFYGDSDSDISAAIASGAEGIRIERGTDSTYKDKYHPGMFGERIIEGTTGHSLTMDGPDKQVPEKAVSSIIDEAKGLALANKELAAGLNGQINKTTPWVSTPMVDPNKTIENNKKEKVSYVDFKNKKPSLDYVTAGQGRIFVNGILLDECYDIQYTYKEAKEPIYGYLSKHWDAVLDGTVVIYGTFTINYKHDMYLNAILSQLQNTNISTQVKNIDNTKRLENDFKASLVKYRASQSELNALKIKLREAASVLKTEQAIDNMKKEESRLTKLDLETKLRNVEKEKSEFWASLNPDYQKELTTKLDDFKQQVSGTYQRPDDMVGPINPVTTQSLEQLHTDGVSVINAKQQEYARAIEKANKTKANLSKKEETLVNLKNLLKTINIGTQQQKYSSCVEAIQKTEQEIENIKADYELESQVAQAISQQVIELAKESQKNIKDKNEIIKNILDSDPNIAKVEQFELQITRIKNSLNTTDSSAVNSSLKDATNAVDKLQNEIRTKENDIANITKTLQDIKNKTARMVDGLTIKSGEIDDRLTKRAEDFDSFNIMIEYNGHIHKILKNCELIGHSHAIMQSGEPVKEVYQFIAQGIVSNLNNS